MPPVSPDLQAALDRGALVLTPTALSAGGLRAAFDRRQRSAGLRVWQPANVLSWSQWLGSLWTPIVLHGHESRLLLNPAQEELLWRDLIRPALEPVSQSSAGTFATMARATYALAASFQLTGRLNSATHTEDTEQFASWAADFSRSCGRNGYLPAAQLPAALAEHLQRQNLTAPAELHLTGFLELTPADAALLNVLRRAGTRIIDHLLPTLPAATRSTLRAATEVEELRAAAHWLRDFLDRHIAANGPDELPAVQVVLASPSPDLTALDSIFREVLAPELDLITADPSSAPWEHAAGQALAKEPVIATLVRLLRGLVRPLPLDEITVLLLSPCLGAEHSLADAARLDAWALRDRPPLRPELTFVELHRRAQSSHFGQGTLGWLTPLLSVVQEAGDLTSPRSYAAWGSFIRDLSRRVHWPGAKPLTVAEFAATEAWDHLLDSIATLDFTGRRVPFAEALAALEHQLQSASFHLPTHAPIRVLSAAEAAASPGDVLILLQATDTNWPPPVRPNPLLPWHLQSAAGMPGAQPARDAARAQRLTDALLSASHVLITHAAEANEAPQRLASTLAHHVENEAGLPWTKLNASKLIPDCAPLVITEEIVDDVPLPPLPSPHVPGGAAVLQLQAACGFRAFAELRLRSTEPYAPELGVDAGRSGSILHRALEVFWLRVHSQGNLNALPSDECEERLAFAVEQAFSTPPFIAPDDPWDKAYRALQMQRLFDLLKGWLNFEQARAPFTVLGREQDRPLTVGPLELQLRVDRIDEVETEDGGRGTVLVDYKTGYDVRPSAWESERPDQPQLPLYTLLPGDSPLRGLAFARVRRGQFAWSGLQAAPGILGKTRVEPKLDELVAVWRRVLTQLAEQFAAGDHSVNPKSYPTTCTHCGQRFLCRLNPETLLDATSELDEGAEFEEVDIG